MFMDWLKEGRIRNNVSQAAGWLIIIGAAEYNYNRDYNNADYGNPLHTPITKFVPDKNNSCYGWKVGAYEPTDSIHGDIEFLYEIDLAKETLKGWVHDGQKKGKSVTKNLKTKSLKKES